MNDERTSNSYKNGLDVAANSRIEPRPHDTQPRCLASEKLDGLGWIQRHLTQREKTQFLAAQALKEERDEYDYQQCILRTFREAKLEAFREYYSAETIKFGITVRAGLAEYATNAHQRLEEAVLKAEAAYLATVRRKVALYDSFADLPQETAMLRAKLLPDLENFIQWTATCIDHAKSAFQERVKRI